MIRASEILPGCAVEWTPEKQSGVFLPRAAVLKRVNRELDALLGLGRGELVVTARGWAHRMEASNG